MPIEDSIVTNGSTKWLNQTRASVLSHALSFLARVSDWRNPFRVEVWALSLFLGWGAVPLLKHIDTEKFEVVCVSPRNYFLMTPLLPSVSVGTVETRTVVESIRSLIGPRVKYVEANCINVDPKAKVITCNVNAEDKTVARGDDIKGLMVPTNREDGASSRIIKDSGTNDWRAGRRSLVFV